jgi:hypothetical protein
MRKKALTISDRIIFQELMDRKSRSDWLMTRNPILHLASDDPSFFKASIVTLTRRNKNLL